MSHKHLTFILSTFAISVLLITLQAKPTFAGSVGCEIPPENMIGWWQANGDGSDFLSNHDGTLGAETDFVP